MMNNSKSKNWTLYNLQKEPLLIVLSGPSGAGKDAVLNRLKQRYPLKHITTVTTRPKRAAEKDNVDYHFISIQKFREMVENNEFLEHAEVYENRYGVPKSPVKQALDNGQDTIIKVDVQGAATIKEILPQAIYIFLAPLEFDELAYRLEKRQTESSPELALRLKTVEEEMKQLYLFDYMVANKKGEIDAAVSQIEAIITAEKCRVSPRDTTL